MSNASINLEADVIRLILNRGEIVRIPGGAMDMRVLFGTAWVSQAGVDHVVGPRASRRIRARPDPAVLSGVGGRPVGVEIRKVHPG